jgi:hypothetical protein
MFAAVATTAKYSKNCSHKHYFLLCVKTKYCSNTIHRYTKVLAIKYHLSYHHIQTTAAIFSTIRVVFITIFRHLKKKNHYKIVQKEIFN